MKLHIRDGFWLTILIAMGLAWWNDASRQRRLERQLRLEVEAAEQSLQGSQRGLKLANGEADTLLAEVRRLRGVIRSSLEDQRSWFELETRGNSIVAIAPGTSSTEVMTLEMLEKIEEATGLKAARLRHLLSPITELRPARERFDE